MSGLTRNSDIYRDIESEEQIVCAFLLNPELLYQVDIRSTDFSHVELSRIYESMLRLYSDGIVFDMKSLVDCGVDKGILFRLFNSMVTTANINYHVARVKQCTFNRKSREFIADLEKKIGYDDFITTAEQAITELYDINGNGSRSIEEHFADINEQIAITQKTGQFGIKTGFSKLNNQCVGLCPRHLWLLGAYTSYGKSTFLSQLTNDVCKAGHSMVIFSVEDSVQDKLIRLQATVSGIPMRDIYRRQCDLDRLKRAEQKITSYDLYIYDNIYTIEEMDLKIKKHKLRGEVDIVAIDYVQNLICPGQSIFEKMSYAAIHLQKMAKKHNVNIFALSQVSAEDKGQIKLRGAQELASAADIVLWMDRDAMKESREFSLIIRKNRPFGTIGSIDMTFNEAWTNMEER